MKKTKSLFPLLMATVMMAMSTNKAWAEEDPRLSALTLGEGVTATFTDEDSKTPWVVTTVGESLNGNTLPADYVPGLRSNTVGVDGGASATNITLTSEKDFDLSFKAYCSSEGVNWDYMRVYVDGRDEEHRVCKIGGSSDNVYTFSQTMTAGTHTLRFLYEKDYMSSGGYDCGFIYNFMAIVPCNPGEHNLSTHVTAQTATCTAAGNVEYWQCSICNNYYSDSNGNTKLNESEIIIPALGHDLNANGECTRCDYSEPKMTEGDNTIQIGAVTGDRDQASAYQLYRYVPAKSGKLTVKSSTSGSGDTYGSLWNSDLSTRLSYDDDSAGNGQFLFTYDVTAHTVYYIGVRSYGGGALSGNFVINVYLDTPCDIDHHTMTLHEANNPTCSVRGNEAYYECSVCGRLYSDNRGENLLSGIPYIQALGHDLDENKLCSRCGETITQLDGTPFDLANYTLAPIYIYSDHFESGPVNQSYTGNLIFTGTGSQMIYLNEMPATGKLALRNATINVSNPAIMFNNNTTELELVIEGNVSIYGGSGALYANVNSNVTVNGPGNLSISSNSNNATINYAFQKLDIDIEGDFTLEGGAFANSSGYEMNINAKSITANGTGSQPFIQNASKATLHAKGNILLESTSTAYEYDNSNDKIWCIKSIESDEGTVLLRMCKGGIHESAGVKAKYEGIPAVSTGNTIFSAFTWKVVDKTTGAATFYGCDPKDFPAITSTTAYDAYISLVKDSEGNTVFDMANLNNGPINLYDGHFSNNAFSNICWEGHPVFTGTGSGNKFFSFNEILSEGNTPIFRNLTIDTGSPCITGSASQIAFSVEGDVELKSTSPVTSCNGSLTIAGTGNLSLIENSSYPVVSSHLTTNISGDLLIQNLNGTMISGSSDYNFDLAANTITMKAAASGSTFLSNSDRVKMHTKGNILMESTDTYFAANPFYDKMHQFDISNLTSDNGTITLLMGKGTEHEYVSILPIPAETPAVSDGNTAVTAYADYVEKSGTKTWFASADDAAANRGPVYIIPDDEDFYAEIDGRSDEPLNVAEDVEVYYTNIYRNFTEGVPASMMMPFAIEADNLTNGTAYTFAGVYKDNNDAWTVDMVSVKAGESVAAYQPFVLIPDDDLTSLYIYGTTTVKATTAENNADINNVNREYGLWSMKGTYAYKQWGADDPELGTIYGIAGQAQGDIVPGDWIKATAGASILPMRAYIKKESSAPAGAKRFAAATTSETPRMLKARFIDGDVTGIGTLNTETGEFSIEGWYDLSGRKIEKPTKSGIYVNGNKKVTIK